MSDHNVTSCLHLVADSCLRFFAATNTYTQTHAHKHIRELLWCLQFGSVIYFTCMLAFPKSMHCISIFIHRNKLILAERNANQLTSFSVVNQVQFVRVWQSRCKWVLWLCFLLIFMFSQLQFVRFQSQREKLLMLLMLPLLCQLPYAPDAGLITYWLAFYVAYFTAIKDAHMALCGLRRSLVTAPAAALKCLCDSP